MTCNVITLNKKGCSKVHANGSLIHKGYDLTLLLNTVIFGVPTNSKNNTIVSIYKTCFPNVNSNYSKNISWLISAFGHIQNLFTVNVITYIKVTLYLFQQKWRSTCHYYIINEETWYDKVTWSVCLIHRGYYGGKSWCTGCGCMLLLLLVISMRAHYGLGSYESNLLLQGRCWECLHGFPGWTINERHKSDCVGASNVQIRCVAGCELHGHYCWRMIQWHGGQLSHGHRVTCLSLPTHSTDQVTQSWLCKLTPRLPCSIHYTARIKQFRRLGQHLQWHVYHTAVLAWHVTNVSCD